ncbi:MAG TPA: rod shape-determining protein MreD [Gammaproteobacteria bacterium]|nr:rod shape-determining protein MreD [Gammaproteobacteria bacterium]
MQTKVVPWHLVLVSLVAALWLTSVPLLKSLQSFWPDWVLLVLIYWNLTMPSRVGLGFAWLTGLVVDATQFALLGEHALEYVLVMLLAGYFRNRMVASSGLHQALLIFLMLLVSVIIEAVTATVLGRNLVFLNLLAVPFAGALLWPIFQYLMRRLFQFRQVA